MFSKYTIPLYRGLSRARSGGLAMLHGLSWAQVRELFLFARRRLNEESLPQVAGSLTFTTLFAIVPLLTVAFAIFTAFPLFNTLRGALEMYFIQHLMPKEIANTILGYVTQFATKATRLSAVGGGALLFSAIATMNVIERVFNRIWRVKSERNWGKRILVYWAIVTLGPLLIGVSLTLTSNLFGATSSVVGMVPFLGAVFSALLSVVLTTGAYTLLYVTVPNRQVDWRDAAWGGLLAALAFEVAKRGFAIFIQQSPTYSRIYGALAALPLFLLWIYLSWMITLVGALLAAALPVVKYERWWHAATPGGAFIDAMAILQVLHEASAHGGTALVGADQIRSRTRLGFDELDALLDKMAGQGWVGHVTVDMTRRARWNKRGGESHEHWVLLANPGQLTVAEVYRLFVFGGMALSAAVAPELGAPAAPDGAEAALLARQVEAAVEQGLAMTLRAHFEQAA